MPTSDNIKYSVHEGRAEITFDRPEVLNAVDGTTLEELNSAIDAAYEDDEVYVILLTGAGRGFCSGGDVSGGYGNTAHGKLAYRQHLAKAQNVTRLLRSGPKPSVAAVNGPAVGSGCDFALACDLRVISEEAYLRQQFVNIGLIPGSGGGLLLSRLIGESKAREYILTGRDITSEAAADLNLVTEVVEPEAVLETARALADEIRDKPVSAVRGAKQLVDPHQSFDDYATAAFDRQWECANHPEHAEAVNALREKREPKFDRPY